MEPVGMMSVSDFEGPDLRPCSGQARPGSGKTFAPSDQPVSKHGKREYHLRARAYRPNGVRLVADVPLAK
jgi:hypothetical protein